jgi:hypothetical protein
MIDLRSVQLGNPISVGPQTTRHLDTARFTLSYEPESMMVIATLRGTTTSRLVPMSNVLAMEPLGDENMPLGRRGPKAMPRPEPPPANGNGLPNGRHREP